MVNLRIKFAGVLGVISPTSPTGCTYLIDSHDHIVSVNEGWISFARENQGNHLQPGQVLETNLWQYIVGLETRYLYKLILDHVRLTRTSMGFPLRCDAPACRRRLTMHIESNVDGVCTFKTKVLRETKRPYQALFDPEHPRSEHYVYRCSWCMNIDAASAGWMPVERAVRHMELDPEQPLPRLMHTVCQDCADRIEQICASA